MSDSSGNQDPARPGDEAGEAAGEELRRLDPRGLIGDAYRIDGAGPEACRSIFLDWALGRSDAEGAPEALRRLHEIYGPRAPEHPMTAVLAEGLSAATAGAPGAARRGRAGRRAGGAET